MFVQQCRLVCGDDHKLLRQTQVTSLGQVRVCWGLSQYIPNHAEHFTLMFETPGILQQFRSVPILFVPEAHQVVRVTLFKRCFSRTNIHFQSTGAVRLYSCFVDNLVGETMPIQWTLFRFAAAAASRLATTLLICYKYMGVVLFNFASHAGQTTVAYFDRVPIKHFT